MIRTSSRDFAVHSALHLILKKEYMLEQRRDIPNQVAQEILTSSSKKIAFFGSHNVDLH